MQYKKTFRLKRAGKYMLCSWDHSSEINSHLLKQLPKHTITYWRAQNKQNSCSQMYNPC